MRPRRRTERTIIARRRRARNAVTSSARGNLMCRFILVNRPYGLTLWSGYWSTVAMKVLHFLGIGRVPTRPMVDATGGTERVALEIAKIQASRGYDVTIASMTDESWQGTWEQVRLLHLTPYSLAGRRFGRHFRLASLIRSGHFDLIHFHEYVRTSFIMRQPNVMQFH